jgi:hypothetical protein
MLFHIGPNAPILWKGREGKGMEGKGREEKGRVGKEREWNGMEWKGREGTALFSSLYYKER